MKKIVLVIALLALALLVVAGCESAVEEMPEVEETEEVAPEVEEVAEVEEVVEELVVSAGTVQILGKEGFDQDSLTVSSGSMVTFVNADMDEKDVTLVVKGPATFTDSVDFGESWEVTFEEAGEYDFWTVGYGVQGSLVVE